jgi:hypothetical protein
MIIMVAVAPWCAGCLCADFGKDGSEEDANITSRK